MRRLLCFSSVAFVAAFLSLESLHAQASRPVETFDAKGRVVSRMILNPDKSSQRTTYVYSTEGMTPIQTKTEEVDPNGQLTKRTVEQFDPTGQVTERRETRIDATGHESGASTKFTYDAEGVKHRKVTQLP